MLRVSERKRLVVQYEPWPRFMGGEKAAFGAKPPGP